MHFFLFHDILNIPTVTNTILTISINVIIIAFIIPIQTKLDSNTYYFVLVWMCDIYSKKWNSSAARILFLEIFPDNTSLFYSPLLLIFTLFPNSTFILSIILIIVLKGLVILRNFNKKIWKCPHSTLFPLSIIKKFWNLPRNTLISSAPLFQTLE